MMFSVIEQMAIRTAQVFLPINKNTSRLVVGVELILNAMDINEGNFADV